MKHLEIVIRELIQHGQTYVCNHFPKRDFKMISLNLIFEKGVIKIGRGGAITCKFGKKKMKKILERLEESKSIEKFEEQAKGFYRIFLKKEHLFSEDTL
jgi:hypothetical protein